MLENWSQTVDLGGTISRPRTIDEVRTSVVGSASALALGSAHSFSPIAASSGTHISTLALPNDVTVHGSAAIVGSGATYADVSRELHAKGLALAAMASLPHITVGGAISTGTHGSGDAIGTLSSAVSAIEIVDAAGDVRWIERGVDADFSAWVVGLGSLGVMTRVQLDVEPTYDVAQTVLTGLSLDAVADHFDTVFGAATSVSVFTRWRPYADAQWWLKRRMDREGPWDGVAAFDTTPATAKMHPLEMLDPVNCTEQLGVAGPWHERLPHFRAEFTPSAGDEIQAEYLLPRAHAAEAIRGIQSLHERITPLLHVTEIRTMRADDLWLSPAYGHDTVGIHFTWHRDPAIYDVLPAIEEIVLPLGARPHWGKVTVATPEQMHAAYPKLRDFLHLRDAVDPHGRFRSRFVTELMRASG